MKQYSIILADPPWNYEVWRDVGQGRTAKSHYATMKTAQIASLPVKDLAAKDCVLFMWATWPNLLDAIKVMQAWGFTYKTCAFTWIKTNKRGLGLYMGLGYWTRANTEVVLLGTRGAPKRINKGVRQTVLSPVREHSRKPDEVHEKILDLMGDLPRIELFARRPYPGWDVWGNEVESSTDVTEVLKVSA